MPSAIRIDRINLLVEQRVSGCPDRAEVARTGAEARAAVRSLAVGPGVHRTLYDLSELGTVRDEVIADAFAQWADPRFTCVRARRVAVVVPSALLRLKLSQPAAARDNMSVFPTRDEAMRWLFAG